MAYRIIRPRRGVKSLWNTYGDRVYKLGEMLVESPESGVGTGVVNIKFGDGVTPYNNLPYGIKGEDIANAMPKSGGTFTGAVTLKGDPTSNLHPATKQYVDNNNKLVTLWTNASPTSNFNAQTISVNLSAYKYVAIQSRPTGGDEGDGFDFIPVGKGGALSSMRKSVGAIYNRYAKVTTTSVEFGNGTFIGGNTGSDNAGWCIPLYIYGIK